MSERARLGPGRMCLKGGLRVFLQRRRAVKLCPKDKTEYGDDIRFCPLCGTPLVAAGLRKGTVVGSSYRINELIGRGWAGGVYRAEHSMMGRPTALKIILSSAVSDGSFLARLRKAVELLSKLDNSRVAMIHDVGVEAPNQVYIASEMVEGKSLARILAEEGPMVATKLLEIIRPVLEGLRSIHQVGGMHGSVKPSNVIVAADGSGPKIVDFGTLGIVQALGDRVFSVQTAYGPVYGEVEYLAPEQIMRREVDGRTDIYAVGLMMYELLTGGKPFRQESRAEAARAQVESTAVAPRVFKPQLRIPKFMEKAIVQALHKSALHRQKSVEELLEQLQAEIVPEEAEVGQVRDVVLVPDETPEPAILMPAEDLPKKASELFTGKTVVAEPVRSGERPEAPPGPAPTEPSGPRFVLYEGKEAKLTFMVDKPETLIGRSPDCDVTLDDQTVSRMHARVYSKPGRFVLEDLDSLNGTYINNEAIKRGHIEDNDIVAFGNMMLVFRTT